MLCFEASWCIRRTFLHSDQWCTSWIVLLPHVHFESWFIVFVACSVTEKNEKHFKLLKRCKVSRGFQFVFMVLIFGDLCQGGHQRLLVVTCFLTVHVGQKRAMSTDFRIGIKLTLVFLAKVHPFQWPNYFSWDIPRHYSSTSTLLKCVKEQVILMIWWH